MLKSKSEILLKAISGIVFIAFGLLTLIKQDNEEEKSVQSRSPFLAGFTLIFLAEWGDKTQIAAALFATKYNALLVLLGTVTSMALLSAAAVYLGGMLSKRVDRKTTTRAAGLMFIALGLASLLL